MPVRFTLPPQALVSAPRTAARPKPSAPPRCRGTRASLLLPAALLAALALAAPQEAAASSAPEARTLLDAAVTARGPGDVVGYAARLYVGRVDAAAALAALCAPERARAGVGPAPRPVVPEPPAAVGRHGPIAPLVTALEDAIARLDAALRAEGVAPARLVRLEAQAQRAAGRLHARVLSLPLPAGGDVSPLVAAAQAFRPVAEATFARRDRCAETLVEGAPTAAAPLPASTRGTGGATRPDGVRH